MNSFFEKIKNLTEVYQDMRTVSLSENSLPFELYWRHKIVQIEGDKVYRAETPYEVYKRLLVYKYFKEQGIEIFAKETVLSEFSNSFVIVTEQPLLTVFEGEIDDFEKKVVSDFGRKKANTIATLFNNYVFDGFITNNCGIDKDNSLKIFDYFANLTVSEGLDGVLSLLDGKGEVLIAERREVFF